MHEEKIAVFDLDGTLWSVNSHYELLNLFYETKFFTSFVYKCLYKLWPYLYVKIRDFYFSKIPDSYIKNISFDFCESVVNILYKKKTEGFRIIIISNAPREIIVKNAAKRLNSEYLCASIGKKLLVLREKYQWDNLFVCTDNTTDCDLLRVADEYYLIIPNNRIKRRFKKMGFVNE